MLADAALKAIEYVGRHPALFLSLPSLYLLLVYPPLWKDVDALSQLIWPAGWGNILHFPPLYCFTGRIPFWLGDCVQALISGQPVPGLRLFGEQHPTWLGIETLIIVQHAALVTTLTLLVRTAAGNPRSRGLVTLACMAASALYAQQQCAGSEASSVSAIILLTVTGVWTYRNNSWVAWTVFSVALFAAMGSRHINCLFVLWLPLAMAGRLLWRWRRRQQFLSPDLAKLGLAVACGALTLLADALVVRVTIFEAGEEYRTDLGFVLIDRITAFLYKLSDSERSALVQRLVAAEPDPIVRAAIEAEGKGGASHSQLADAIQEALRQQGAPQTHMQARGDVALLGAALAYLKTLHPKLVDLILSDFVHGYLREDNGKLSLNRFLANRTAARMRADDPKDWQALDQLRSIDQEEAVPLVSRASTDIYLMLGGPIPIGVLMLANLGLTFLLAKRRKGEVAWLAQSLLLTSAVLYFANCIFAYFNDRYTLPLLVCAIAAFALQTGGLFDLGVETEPAEVARAEPVISD